MVHYGTSAINFFSDPYVMQSHESDKVPMQVYRTEFYFTNCETILSKTTLNMLHKIITISAQSVLYYILSVFLLCNKQINERTTKQNNTLKSIIVIAKDRHDLSVLCQSTDLN